MSAKKPVFSFWARFTGLGAAICLLISAPIQYFYPDWYWLHWYVLAVGAFVALWEFPMPGLQHLGFFYKNFFLRGVLYVLMAAPGMVDAPTTTGALGLAATGVIYLVAGFLGEKWIHPSEWQRRKKRKSKKTDVNVEHQHRKDEPIRIETGENRVLQP